MQLHAVCVRVEPERHRQGVEINIPVSQHYSLWIGARPAGIEKLGEGIFVESHDVGAVWGGARQAVVIILRRKPARLGWRIEQDKSLDVGDALAKRIDDFQELFLQEKYLRAGVVQNVG